MPAEDVRLASVPGSPCRLFIYTPLSDDLALGSPRRAWCAACL
jgi:hypothetical protein